MAYRVVCKQHGVTLAQSRYGKGQSYRVVQCPCRIAHDRYQRDGQIHLLNLITDPYAKPKTAKRPI